MGKRQPFTCPYPGCGKTGKLSGLKQHFRDKHREPVPDARLETLITNGEMLAMNYERELGKSYSLAELPSAVWRRAFLSGLAIGSALGIAITIAIGAGVINSCQGKSDICPASIARLVNNR